jgi:hypothetical protein
MPSPRHNLGQPRLLVSHLDVPWKGQYEGIPKLDVARTPELNVWLSEL